MAGLGMFVKPDAKDFIGKEAIVRQKAEGAPQKLVGIELEGRAIPRHGYEVYAGEELIGTVTTGYQSISTGKSVCMALIDPRFAALGTEVQIQIHRRRQNGIVVKKRFYAKSYKK